MASCITGMSEMEPIMIATFHYLRFKDLNKYLKEDFEIQYSCSSEFFNL
jgi:hypothetical protein